MFKHAATGLILLAGLAELGRADEFAGDTVPPPPAAMPVAQPVATPEAPPAPLLPPPGAVAPVDLQWGWIYPFQAFSNAPRNIWLEAEYFLFNSTQPGLPPLVTGGPQGSQGVIGQPGTVILVGGIDVDHQNRSGGRFHGGLWLDYDQSFGIEGGYLFAGERTVHLPAGAQVRPLMPVLARPFYDVVDQQQSSSLVVQPNLRTGLVDVAYSTFFQAADFSVICNRSCGPNHRIDLLVGFRFMELDDEIRIIELSKIDRNAPLNGATRLDIQDEFETRTRLIGAQVALRAEFHHGCWFGSVLGRVSFGGMEQQISNFGVTYIDAPDQAPEVYNGGFLALPSNTGIRDRWKFAAVPELSLKLGYTFWHRYTVFASYTVLYWQDVLRAGDQIDLRINPVQLPLSQAPSRGPNLPEFLFNEADYWLHGIGIGCEIRF